MNCSCWDKLSLDENEVNDDEDTEIEIMRPKRGLDQNDKTNQTPVNEKSGNSESKSKSEEEAERKESVHFSDHQVFSYHLKHYFFFPILQYRNPRILTHHN
jgi:hypothetical protein